MKHEKLYVYSGPHCGALYARTAIAPGETLMPVGERPDPRRFLTHSEKPNCAVLGALLVALRCLRMGDEITCDHSHLATSHD